MNVRDALWLARKLGASVADKRATDDVVICHPLVPHRVTQSLGRKDANRELTGFLKNLWDRLLCTPQPSLAL